MLTRNVSSGISIESDSVNKEGEKQKDIETKENRFVVVQAGQNLRRNVKDRALEEEFL